jgi:hypothetical protein
MIYEPFDKVLEFAQERSLDGADNLHGFVTHAAEMPLSMLMSET